MATYWENSCSFGLRYVSWYKYLIVSLVFSHLGFWSGNLFLIAPFPDLCLLVPFSLYINDISADIESEIRPFADDCVCCREIKNEEDTLKLQRDIDRLGSWARKWGMRFQSVKCNMMQLTNKRSSTVQANYTLEGTVVENVESINYLGVTITNDLKWNTHISNVCTKANRTLGFLRRNLYSCPPDVKEATYKGLVRPVLEYGSSVWDPHTHGLQEELERSKIVRQGL